MIINEDSGINQISPQAGDLRKIGIFSIPWGHNKLIIDKCKGDINKAVFYVGKTLENNWSRAVLMNFLDTDLYERQGKAITNFAQTLPAVESDLAQAITKESCSYGLRGSASTCPKQLQKFLLELGNGFAFVGREVRLEIGTIMFDLIHLIII